MKVLIIGSGGREHALAKACRANDKVTEVLVAPGNAGIAQEAKCLPFNRDDKEAFKSLITNNPADIVVIGSNRVLLDGGADFLKAEGIPVFGASQAAMMLENDALTQKQFFTKHNIPSASWAFFTTVLAAKDGIKKMKYPSVLKVSGLKAGRNVSIARDFEEAQNAIESLIQEGAFGNDGQWLLAEEYLFGEPISASLVMSEDSHKMFPLCKTYKRIGEGNTGPNTPGVGAYAPTKSVPKEVEEIIVRTIIKPFMDGLMIDQLKYTGPIYLGIMLTRNGPMVFDVKVRFGDPECQVLSAVSSENLIDIIQQCVSNQLSDGSVMSNGLTAVAITKTLQGYPGVIVTQTEINEGELFPDSLSFYHSNTVLSTDGNIHTGSGRPLCLVATGKSLIEATIDVYRGCSCLTFDNEYYRKDIALKEIENTEIF